MDGRAGCSGAMGDASERREVPRERGLFLLGERRDRAADDSNCRTACPCPLSYSVSESSQVNPECELSGWRQATQYWCTPSAVMRSRTIRGFKRPLLPRAARPCGAIVPACFSPHLLRRRSLSSLRGASQSRPAVSLSAPPDGPQGTLSTRHSPLGLVKRLSALLRHVLNRPSNRLAPQPVFKFNELSTVGQRLLWFLCKNTVRCKMSTGEGDRIGALRAAPALLRSRSVRTDQEQPGIYCSLHSIEREESTCTAHCFSV